MDTKNTSRQLRYLEEVHTPLHRAGFGTLPVEGEQLPVLWNGAPLCRITGKGSVFYRREDADTPQAEDALYRVEDIAAKTLEYMTAMEAAPQLKASGMDGDYRILADFGGTVLAGSPSKYGVQFVTWDWDYDRTGVVHGHYFMENYDAAKQDFATRSGLIQKEQLFSPEQLTEIYRCCTDSVNEDFFELTDKLKHQSLPILERMLETLRTIRDRRLLWSEDIVSLNKKISELSSQNQTLAFLKQNGLVDPDIFIVKSNELTRQLRQAKLDKEKLMDAEGDATAQRTRELIALLEDGPDFLDRPDTELCGALVAEIIVESNDTLRFRLHNGLELRESIERTVR